MCPADRSAGAKALETALGSSTRGKVWSSKQRADPGCTASSAAGSGTAARPGREAAAQHLGSGFCRLPRGQQGKHSQMPQGRAAGHLLLRSTLAACLEAQGTLLQAGSRPLSQPRREVDCGSDTLSFGLCSTCAETPLRTKILSYRIHLMDSQSSVQVFICARQVGDALTSLGVRLEASPAPDQHQPAQVCFLSSMNAPVSASR